MFYCILFRFFRNHGALENYFFVFQQALRTGMIVFSVFGGVILCLIIPLCLPLSVHITIWKWWGKITRKFKKSSGSN